MIDDLIYLSAPIAVCVLFTGILSYFGNHILSRGIIFIDIALAQIAALGAMIGILIGYAEGSGQVQFISLVFTIIIISIFALTKFKKQIIPQEAIIGIIYGLGLGLAMLLAEKIPGGSNYITKTITGNILWVTWSDVLTHLVIFIVIGIVHLFFYKSFIKISSSGQDLPYSVNKVRMYELIFYITFGIVIVMAVPIAGIFLVFIQLIAPTAAITLFTNNWKKRFIGSWIIGIVGSVVGMYISYIFNVSNGPAIVCLLGILVFILVVVKLIMQKRSSVVKA